MDKLGHYIKDISNNDYHADKEFVSSSQLKYAIKDHGTFRWEMNKPKEEVKWDKDSAMNLGTAFHSLILEPHLYDEEIAHIDIEGLNLRTKADKITLYNMLEQHKDKVVLPNTAKEKLKRMREATMSHPFAKRLLEVDGTPEMSGYYEDDFYKLKCRFRPDRLLHNFEGNSAIVDVKTCANMDEFEKTAKWKLSYDLSCAMYLHGHKLITGETDVPFYFLVQETNGHYRTAVYKASDNFIETGRKKYSNALSNIKIARKLPMDKVIYQEVDYQEI